MKIRERKISRRNFILSSTLCGVGGVSGLGYTFFVEPNWLEVNHYFVSRAGDKPAISAVKILHLSDFHRSPCVSLEFINTAVELGITEKPDLILLTGDYITAKDLEQDLQQYADILKKLSNVAPCFAVYGNHDGGQWVRRRGYADLIKVSDLLTRANIEILHNATRSLKVKGRTLHLFGLGDMWADDLNAEQTFKQSSELGQGYRIVLSHNPDSKELLKDFTWDLMLCGHTHGGQLRLPIIGTPFAPVRDKRFVEGLNAWQGRWIFTTKGVGNLHGARFNCRPEVAILHLISE